MPNPDQFWAALDSARSVRRQRAELKRAIRHRERSVAEVLRDPPKCTERLRVVDLLTWPPYFGLTRAREVLGRLHLFEGAKLGDLTVLERRAIAEELRREHPYVLGSAA